MTASTAQAVSQVDELKIKAEMVEAEMVEAEMDVAVEWGNRMVKDLELRAEGIEVSFLYLGSWNEADNAGQRKDRRGSKRGQHHDSGPKERGGRDLKSLALHHTSRDRHNPHRS